MKTVGIRELKNNLGRYIKDVKGGERLVVTDRRKEIAIIIPLGNTPEESKILDMTRNGIVSWSGGKPTGMADRVISKGGAVSDAVIEDRR